MRKQLAMGALVALLTATPVRAAVIEGVDFVDARSESGVALRLHNVALLRWYFLKAYVAALYLGDGVAPGRVLGDVPKRLEIEYFYGIGAEDFAKSTRVTVGRNVPPGAYEALRTRIERFNALYRDVKPGDRYALTYLPGRGTELALNGEVLGRVEGADFAAAMFSIWLGEDPVDDDLKTDLLGP